MSGARQNSNLAARAGNWSAAHWKTATFGWLALVIATIVIGSASGTVMITNAEDGVGESARATATLDRAFPDHAGEAVLVQSTSTTAREPAFKREVQRVAARLGTLGQIQSLQSPLAPGNHGQVS